MLQDELIEIPPFLGQKSNVVQLSATRCDFCAEISCETSAMECGCKNEGCQAACQDTGCEGCEGKCQGCQTCLSCEGTCLSCEGTCLIACQEICQLICQSEQSQPFIYDNGRWKPATPYIYNGGWKPAEPYIY